MKNLNDFVLVTLFSFWQVSLDCLVWTWLKYVLIFMLLFSKYACS